MGVTEATPTALATLYQRQSPLAEAARELRAIVRYRDLLRYLVRQTLAKESTGRVFGTLWWLVDPLVLMGVYVFFVDIILNRGGDNFAFFVLVAVLAWKHVTSGINGAIVLTLLREQAMRQVAFPRSVVPLSSVLAETFHFVLGIGVFVVIAAPFGIYPSATFPLVFVIMAVQTALVLGVGFVIAALNVFYRDLQNLTTYVLRIGFFLSPTLYETSQIPHRYRGVYQLNPFATLLPAYRDVLIGGKVPHLRALGIVAAVSLAVLALGFVVFVRLQARFAKVA